MADANRWVSNTAGHQAVLRAIESARREAGGKALDPDDVTISVVPDGESGVRIHAHWDPYR